MSKYIQLVSISYVILLQELNKTILPYKRDSTPSGIWIGTYSFDKIHRKSYLWPVGVLRVNYWFIAIESAMFDHHFHSLYCITISFCIIRCELLICLLNYFRTRDSATCWCISKNHLLKTWWNLTTISPVQVQLKVRISSAYGLRPHNLLRLFAQHHISYDFFNGTWCGVIGWAPPHMVWCWLANWPWLAFLCTVQLAVGLQCWAHRCVPPSVACAMVFKSA